MKEKLQSAKMSANRLLSLLLVAVVVLAMLPAIEFPAAAADVDWTTIGESDCRYKIETTGTGESQEVTLTIAPADGKDSGTLPNNYMTVASWPWYESCNQITKVVIEEGVKAGNSTAYMFFYFNKLTTIEGLTNLDTSNVTDMRGMFYGCCALKTLDISGFDTSSVKNMSSMFTDCSALTTLDLSGFNTSKVTNMEYMFDYCVELTTLDISGVDTSSVTNMSSMFSNCVALTTLDLSGFNTSKVTNMEYMFDMFDMEETGKVGKLKTILVGKDWNTGIVVASDDMFRSCTNLVGGAGTKVGTTVDKTYACVDGGSSAIGYLTSPDQYLADKGIILINGKAYVYQYDPSTYKWVAGLNITAAVAEKGLKYVAAVPAGEDGEPEAIPAHWEMKDFNYETSSPRGVAFGDAGTKEASVDVSVRVIGTGNTIKIKATADTASRALHLAGNYANITFSGTGSQSSAITLISGDVTDAVSTEGIKGEGNTKLTFKGLTVMASGGKATEGWSYGISLLGTFTVGDDTNVLATSKDGGRKSFAVQAKDVKIEGTGLLQANCECSISSQDKKAVYFYEQSEDQSKAIVAMDADQVTKLTWDSGDDKTYRKGSEIATVAIMTAVTNITVGTQTGTLTYGTAGSTTYTVTQKPATPALTEYKVLWKNTEDTYVETAPTGVTSATLGDFTDGVATLTVSSDGTTPAGSYSFIVTAKDGEDVIESVAATLTVTPKSISGCTVTGLAKKYAHTGEAIEESALAVKDGETTLKKDTDYTVTYENNTNKGTATVTIEGKGNYTGKITQNFEIVDPCTVEVKADATTVQHLDKFTVTATVTGKIPDGYNLVWVIGGNAKWEIVETSKDGNSVTVLAESSGDLEIAAKVVDGEGNVLKYANAEEASATTKVKVEQKFDHIIQRLLKIFKKVFINVKILLGK